MTEAELKNFCEDHGIPQEDAELALRQIEKLTEPPPHGISLPKYDVGHLMEAAAHIHHVLRDRDVPTFGKAGGVFGAIAVPKVIALVFDREIPEP